MLKNAPSGNHASAQRRSARPNPLANCPLTATYAAVGGKWKMTLVYWIAREQSHFSSLLRRAAPIAPKVLTEQLRELEADGIVARCVTGAVPAPVLYRVTPYGASVLPVIDAARTWGERHLARNRGALGDGALAVACARTSFPVASALVAAATVD